MADTITVKSERRLRYWTRGLFRLGGRLEIQSDGLHWTTGRLAAFEGVRGTVWIPWDDITHVEIGDIPGTIRGLGAGFALHLRDGRRLDGSFLGSEATFRATLAESPLGGQA